MRVKIEISYDGTNFFGYQKQHNFRTVQEELEKVLCKVFNTMEVSTNSSGRTDRYVHAISQVVHFDIITTIDTDSMIDAINTRLPKDIRCNTATVVSDSFHSRFNAIKKEYHYVITKDYNIFERNYKTYLRNLDIDKLKEIREIFVGVHDFFSYTKYKENQSTVREIYSIEIEELNNDIIIKFSGNGFMRYQVRYLVGAMISYATNKLSKEYLLELLYNKYKEKRIKVAESKGLYLYKVYY